MLIIDIMSPWPNINIIFMQMVQLIIIALAVHIMISHSLHVKVERIFSVFIRYKL